MHTGCEQKTKSPETFDKYQVKRLVSLESMMHFLETGTSTIAVGKRLLVRKEFRHNIGHNDANQNCRTVTGIFKIIIYFVRRQLINKHCIF